jgi:hypothetical protein
MNNKYIKGYESFIDNNPTNEELLGLDKLTTGIKNLWKKGMEKIKKIKGGKEIEDIYQKYLTILQKEISSKAKIELSLTAASKGDTLPNPVVGAVPGTTAPGTTAPAAAVTGATTGTTPGVTPKKESFLHKVFEADNVDAKAKYNALTRQIPLIKQTIDAYIVKMDLEFNKILDKYKKEPQTVASLKSLIDIKKQEVKLAMFNSEKSYLQAIVDQVPEAKTMITKLDQDIKKISDVVSKSTDDLGSLKSSGKNYKDIYQIYSSDNKNVIFLLPGKDMKLYDPKKKLSDQSEIVGVGEIKALNDQNNDASVTINYEDKDIKMGYGKIIGQAPVENAQSGEENTEAFKSYGVEKPEELVGKEVYYMKDGFDKNAPSADLVGKNEVTAFDEEKGLTIKGKDEKTFEKGIDQLISMEEGDKLTGNKSEEEPEESKEPAELLADLDEDTKKNVLSYADFIKNPANKAKADRIKKIITTNAG